MTDVLTPDQRRKYMSRIRGVNTKPEKILRSLLFREGFVFDCIIKSFLDVQILF